MMSTSTSAQGIPDVPSLGFTIDPERGAVGDTVNGQVDPADIAEHCITDPEEFAAGIVSFFNNHYGPYLDNVLEREGRADLDPSIPVDYVRTLIGVTVAFGISQNPELVREALGSTFVLAFADIATASPIDPIGSFDPNSGEGSVAVPDIAPGNQPVIATCVEIPEEFSTESLVAAEAVATAYLEANFEPPFPLDIGAPDSQFEEVAAEIFPVFLRELVEPRALGIAFYCVDDGEGSCDKPVEPTTPTTIGGNGGGTTAPNGDGGDGTTRPAPGATPTPGRASYTG